MSGFDGVHATAVTPRGKQGEIDYGAGFELVDHLSNGGVSGILLFGPAGEYHAFTPAERARLVYLCAKRSRVPVLAGIGAPTLDASIDLAREAHDAGAAALVLPPPYFYQYDQDDLRAFFRQAAVELGPEPPIFIYRTAALAVETTLELWNSGRFGAIVDATGDSAAVARLKAGGAAVLCGDDALAAAHGRCGMVSSAACAVPELVSALHRALRDGAAERAQILDHALQEFVRWAARFPEPAAVKLATGLRGLKTGPLAMPLSPEKQKDLDAFRDWFQRWLPTVRKLAADA